MTQEEIAILAEELAKHIAINTKKVLTIEEASEYLGLKVSYIHKLTSSNKIPYYKCEGGKSCYFMREELEGWMTRYRVPSQEEIKGKALSYCASKAM